jgi:glycosyltransferase involved in cell wall biosynthesis
MNISILIPTYNRPRFLKECLESCICQSHPPFEILIGDDSPSKESEIAICSLETKCPIVYKWNNPSLGQAENIDSLIGRASGDLLCLMHDDDKLEPDALEKLSRIFAVDRDVILSFGKQYIISNEGRLKEEASLNLNASFFRTSDRAGIQTDILKSALLQQMPNNGFLVRSECAKKIGYSKAGERYGDACDFGFALELALTFSNSKAYFLDEYTASYRESSFSIARSKTNNDAPFRAFSIQYLLSKSRYELDKDIKRCLETKSPVAIQNAIELGELSTAGKWMFSRYHRRRIISLGGMKRLLVLIKALYHHNI